MSRRNRFGFSPASKGVAASLDWLQLNLPRRKPQDDAPQEIVVKAWQRHITREDGSLDMGALSAELDATWQAVAARLPDNPAIQLSENAEGETELSLGALAKLEEPNSLLQLRAAVADLMPRVDLPRNFIGNRCPYRLLRSLHSCVRTQCTS